MAFAPLDMLRRAVPRPIRRLLRPLVVPLLGGIRPPPKTRIDLADTAAVSRFVRRSDELGGPDAPAATAWWAGLAFEVPPALSAAAHRLDPLSAEYLAVQDGLYEAIVGTPYRGTASEITQFDMAAAEAGHLAYPNWAPEALNRHLGAMAGLAEQFDRPGLLRILEAGSGWGFGAEYLARLGHRVVGVDVNPDFIATATRRSRRLGLGIDYRPGTFECLPGPAEERFDVIYTSAALHHSRDPFAALRGMAARLKPGGVVILASEPFIPAGMWPHWGLRTDPISVYCMAKFGWWESGWTREYMAGLFARAGLGMRFVDHGTDLERYMIGSLNGTRPGGTVG